MAAALLSTTAAAECFGDASQAFNPNDWTHCQQVSIVAGPRSRSPLESDSIRSSRSSLARKKHRSTMYYSCTTLLSPIM